MATKTVNGVPVEDIVIPIADDPELVEWIAQRKVKAPIVIVESDPSWPSHFKTFQSRIIAALEPSGVDEADQQTATDQSDKVTILRISHIGSTSVPKLPAKAVIDIDLVLSSISRSAEAFYVPRLEAAGFQFLLREPAWYEHRFFVAYEPMACNLHVWGARCPEVERHRIFRDWLREHDEDRELYARVKRECAAVAREKGEDMRQYTLRKDEAMNEIKKRAYTALGYLHGA